MTFDIPQGWRRVESGAVRLGDKLFVPTTWEFKVVDATVLDQLGFLDARAVEELVCVIREETVDTPIIVGTP